MIPTSGRILIADDDPVQRRLLEEAVKRFGYRSRTVENGAQAVEALSGPDGADIDLLILDLVMPELDGMGVIARLREMRSSIPIIVQTAHAGIDAAVNAIRAGAQDFVVKPVSPERLEVAIRTFMKMKALEGEITRIHKQSSGTFTFDDIVTRSEAMERVIRVGSRAAHSQIPVLIEGESGVGKELIARAIQGTSERRARAFVTVNCGAIPEHLVESILFGHEKGAFTGAVEKHVGKFQEAHGGTLFLDEVGELPPDIQVKLLRALQEGEIDPIGARRPVKVDFRLISATNRRLVDLVKDGQFREDLYYRLNVFPLWLPPLRDRREDIPDLVRHFLARFVAEEGRSHITTVAPDAVAMLQAYDWPGNIRQLENAVFRAVVLCEGDHLRMDDFPQVLASVGQDPGQPASVSSDAIGSSGAGMPPRPDHLSRAARSVDSGFPTDPGPAHEVGTASAFHPAIGAGGDPSGRQVPFGYLRCLDDHGHVRALDSIEADMIRTAIDHYSGRMTEVARRLSIGRSTLYRKLKDYGLDATDDADAAE
ncbi:sigma-54 dependent transcriptional regulator [Stappia sp. ES.058]|uniref:sigma-54-dependent transcriptional regulator n=1 Tax=Stappia sp. ES.058 TaxID=1881061 RepID=UPI000879B62B|nr:sigma-54 dependent transcriptional regulator [Stappia sp. ES.058]SDU35634.1 DNA-binding transcriptional response regulator, NtrC family, contains REC, AAA-type ATPase, and a Fis-type DNA-binding domains [Stappia sp. ES.058]